MKVIDAIMNRRSIRKYQSKPIEQEAFDILLQSAMYAPTARDTQSWQFLVIREKANLEKIIEVHPYAKMLKYAAAAILVCGDIEREENLGYLNTNCSAATQNILLSAHALGIGSVWLGVYPREERMEALKKLFQLPGNIVPVSLISLGYPDEIKPLPDRFDQGKIHYETW